MQIAEGRLISVAPAGLASGLNMRPRPNRDEQFEPSLMVVIGENESTIASLAQQLISLTFEQKRSESILYHDLES